MFIITEMKLFLLLVLTTFSTTLFAQFDNNTQVTASDGTVYKLTPIGASANRVKVMNATNTLHNEVKKYPTPSESFQLSPIAAWLMKPLNEAFTKERLLALSQDAANTRIFCIFDAAATIREVIFYVPKNTAFTVDEIRRLENILKQQKIQVVKPENGRPGVFRAPNFYPELSNIPYFPYTGILGEFYIAYKAIKTTDRRGNIIWTRGDL